MALIMTVHLETDKIDGILFEVNSNTYKVIQIRPEAHHDSNGAVGGDLNKYKSRIVKFLQDFINTKNIDTRELMAISIIHPGRIDSTSGEVVVADRFLLKNIPLASIISDIFQVETLVFHDGPCLALGEFKHGWLTNQPSSFPKCFVYIIVGEGVGSCIVIDGVPFVGATLNAGTLGHIVIDPAGRMCTACNRPGCLETYTCRSAIASDIMTRFKRVGKVYNESSNFNRSLEFYNDPSDIDADQIASAVKDKNEFAIPAIHFAAEKLGLGVAMIVDYLNPELIIFGGELMDKIPHYYDLTLQVTQDICSPLSWSKTTCRLATVGRQAEHWGAVDLALEKIHALATTQPKSTK